MYPVSNAYINQMKGHVVRTRMEGTVSGLPFTDNNILEGSFSITNQCSDNEQVQIGQVYIAELKTTFLNNTNIPRYSLKNKTIEPYFGLKLPTGGYENVPLGVYNIDEAEWTASGVVIKAYDNIVKFDKSFSTQSLTGTPYELMKLACTSCDLELNMTSKDFKAFPNGTRKLKIHGDNDVSTWRDCVGWIAQTLAANVFADRFGKICLKAYNQTPVDTINTENRLTGSAFSDFETRYTGISVVNIDDQMTNYYNLDVDDALTYNLGTNPFIQGVDAELMCREILTAIQQICYVPFSADMICNPAYDLMDVLIFEGGFADGEKVSCITKYTFTHNGKYSACGVGSDPALATAKSKSDKNISGLMGQISAITSSINHLIYDYNTGPFEVGQDEMTMGMITYYISESADIEGHFLMHYRASESTHMIIRFYDQVTEELFSPVEYDILPGEGAVEIPHAYLNRQPGFHVVYATAQVYSGKLDVDTRGVFFTLDAGNFAEAVDDVTMDVRDITLRQLMESYGPDQVWIVGIEDGKMFVSRREYSSSYSMNPKWEGVYSAGDAIDAAIEFDGKWVLRAGEQKFTLETQDQPWYFWVDPDGVLYGQEGELDDTRFVIDENVSAVNACRGYSSNIYVEQDQGLVVAYIKDGKPYYVQYVYDTQLEEKRWLPPELLTDLEVEDFRIHRLNDYRLSFELTTATKNIWMYTERTYVAQAVPKEEGYVALDDRTMFLYTHKDTDLSVTYSNWISEDGLTMKIFVSKQVKYFNPWYDYLDIDESSITHSMVKKVEVENGESGAVIIIHLKQTAKKLITNVVVNPRDDGSIQAFIPDWGYIKAPKTTLVFDTTIYRWATMPVEEAGIQNSDNSMAYNLVTVLQTATSEEAEIQNTDADMRYSHIDQLHADTAEEAEVQISGVTMAYELVAPAPI